MNCQADTPLALLVPCNSQGRWVGPDGRVRCSLHHITEFGHRERLVRVEGYEPPGETKEPAIPERLPGQHARLDSLAEELNIDFGDAMTVAEKQAVIESERKSNG